MQRSLKSTAGRLGRLAAAAGIGAAMTLGFSGAAVAAPQTGGVDFRVAGFVVNKKKEGQEREFPVVKKLTFTTADGKKVLAFCIDMHHKLPNSEAVYKETDPSAAPDGTPKLKPIEALLASSIPAWSVKEVAAAAKIDVNASGLSDRELENSVYAGTQAAIWNTIEPSFFELVLVDQLTAKQVQRAQQAFPRVDMVLWAKKYKVISAVYRYLLGKAPEPSLAITPGSASVNVGSQAGPFTVTSTGVDEATLTASAGALVDADNKPVTTRKNGEQFRVDCKQPGTITIEAKAKYRIPTLTIFTNFGGEVSRPSTSTEGGEELAAEEVTTLGKNTPPPPPQRQTLITVTVKEKELKAQATVNCTEAGGGLPVTGAPLAGTLTAGVVLLAAGAGLFLVRRRRIQFTA